MKSIEDLREKREELNRQILKAGERASRHRASHVGDTETNQSGAYLNLKIGINTN